MSSLSLEDIRPSDTPILVNALISRVISKGELITLVNAKIDSVPDKDKAYWLRFKETLGDKS